MDRAATDLRQSEAPDRRAARLEAVGEDRVGLLDAPELEAEGVVVGREEDPPADFEEREG